MLATLKRTVAEFKEDNLTDWAAALTYYSVLSVFPALIALVSIVGLVGDPQTITKQLTDIVTSIGPASAADTLKQPIEDITKSSGTAGILLIVGIVSALWTASGYVGAFMRASNAIYEVEEGRSFVKLRPLQMLVTLVLVLLLAVVLLALVLTGPVAEQVGSAIGVGSAAVTIWDIAKWPVLAAMVLLAFAILYYSAPNAKLPGLQMGHGREPARSGGLAGGLRRHSRSTSRTSAPTTRPTARSEASSPSWSGSGSPTWPSCSAPNSTPNANAAARSTPASPEPNANSSSKSAPSRKRSSVPAPPDA